MTVTRLFNFQMEQLYVASCSSTPHNEAGLIMYVMQALIRRNVIHHELEAIHQILSVSRLTACIQAVTSLSSMSGLIGKYITDWDAV